MTHYEYKVVAAPTRGVKAKGLKTPEARFSHAIEQLMNDMAAEGWEYQRAETLPSVERSGLTSTTTQWRNILVFRRPSPAQIAAAAAPHDDAPETPKDSRKEPTLPPIVAPRTAEDDASHSEGASRMLRDNGVEEVSDVAGMTQSLKGLAAKRNATNPKD